MWAKLLSAMMTTSWFILMTWLSHQPGVKTRKTSKKLSEKLHFLNKKGNLEKKLRKSAHVICYTVLTVLLSITFFLWRIKIWYGIGALIIWCWLDEWTKRRIKGRHYSTFDVGLNLLGTVIGMAGILLWDRM